PEENLYRESAQRTAKLAWLLDRLRLTAKGPAHVGFIQEFNSAENPETLLSRRCREYQTLAGLPGSSNDIQRPVATANSSHQLASAAVKFDTAILVHDSLGPAELVTAASCPRATFAIVPARGLLLVSIHGPFRRGRTTAASDFYTFHRSIIDAIHRFMEAGWTPLIGGDFNFAPFPGDRADPSTRAHEADCLRTIPNYEAALDVVDFANYRESPRANGRPYSYTDPRHHLFTHRVLTADQDGSLRTYYNSRIDLFLVPTRLAMRQGALYDASNAGASSDHDTLFLVLPAAAESTATPRTGYRLSPDDCTDPVLAPTIAAILRRYDATGLFTRPDSREHFAFYASLLGDIVAAAQTHHKRSLTRLDRQLCR
ncbi:hypothetical protein GGI05_007105, partial [Coemansia sp. RSA 2603]